ncbi:hypothetical protein PoB_004831400 [Plakobranchus ocellatus]|uniref:Uncharacterized protein n=1 Tax=Plakobranchus ocellatus TaxID=259542 RepID=A0AAV4BTW6_9GAST|nr:hypothetical protein PoB_004831400 [Plakobranchus ocellatus]
MLNIFEESSLDIAKSRDEDQNCSEATEGPVTYETETMGVTEHNKVYERTEKGTREEERGRGRCRRTEKDIRLFQKTARLLSSKRARPETPVSRTEENKRLGKLQVKTAIKL